MTDSLTIYIEENKIKVNVNENVINSASSTYNAEKLETFINENKTTIIEPLKEFLNQAEFKDLPKLIFQLLKKRISSEKLQKTLAEACK